MSNEFKREERYVVVKISKMHPHPKFRARHLASLKQENAGALVDCVVVERDWPEYETVWRMIEARITGRHPEQAEGAQGDLWAVHAQGPDDLYAAFSREDAERHAAELNALPMPEGISVSAVVVASPWPAAEHWKYLAEQEREHNGALVAQAGQAPQAWLDVQAERRRQVAAEGWTPEHDNEHDHGQMARAAACYALAGSSAADDKTTALLVSLAWPWDQQWWKPTTARRDLVKACALTLAEIERLDRAAAPTAGGSDA